MHGENVRFLVAKEETIYDFDSDNGHAGNERYMMHDR